MDAANQPSGGGFPFHFPYLHPHPPPPPTDTELTNLNWVAGAPVPMQNPVSPTRKGGFARSKHFPQHREGPSAHHAAGVAESRAGSSFDGSFRGKDSSPFKREVGRKEKAKKSSSKRGDKGGEVEEEEGRRKKPNCSYTSLIGLALMASEDGCLPVSEIYTYIEEQFSYFKSAPDGWKNSIRHNLSLNPAFRKVKDSMRWQGKKGYYWEVVPERRASVEREVERYLRQEGKLKDMDITDGISPFPSCLQASIPAMPQTPSPPPICSFQFCTGTQPYYDIVSSMLRYYPPSPWPLPPPPPPLVPDTTPDNTTNEMDISLARAAPVTLLDTDLSPGQFAGFPDPASCPTHSTLHDLFGLQLLSVPPSHPHTLTTFPPPHSEDSSFLSQYPLFHSETPIPLPDGPSSRRLRKMALDQLTLPEEHHSWTYGTTSSRTLHPDYYGAFDQSYYMSLEDCPVMDGSGESGEERESGEGRESGERRESGDDIDCKGHGCVRKKRGRRGRRKRRRRRVSAPHRPTTSPRTEPGVDEAPDTHPGEEDPTICDNEENQTGGETAKRDTFTRESDTTVTETRRLSHKMAYNMSCVVGGCHVQFSR